MYRQFTLKLGLQALLFFLNLFIFLEKCKMKTHSSVKKKIISLFRGPAIIRPFRVDLTLFTCTDVHFILVLATILLF